MHDSSDTASAGRTREIRSAIRSGHRPCGRNIAGAGIETFESCDGGPGHAYTEPTVRFHGNRGEGFRALAVAIQAGLKVTGLRRVWPILDSEPTGPGGS